MELRHEFEVPTGLEDAGTFLLDVPRVASCLPGAELTEAISGNICRCTGYQAIIKAGLKAASVLREER